MTYFFRIKHIRSIIQTIIGIICLMMPLHHVNAVDEKSFLVGFVQDDMTSKWRRQQVFALQEALKKHPSVELIYADSHRSIPAALKNIEDLHAKGVDLLVISPQHPTLLNGALAKVYDDGIPVVLLTRRIHGDKYTTHISPDDYKIGGQAAHKLAESMNKKGDILIVEGLATATTAMDRTAGFLQEIKKYKNIHITGKVSGNFQRSDAIKSIVKTLENGISFDGLFIQSNTMAVGVRTALNAFGINPADIPTVTVDYTVEVKAAIRNGQQTASFTYPNCGREAADVIWDILNGKTVNKSILVPSTMVTKDNIEDIEPML